MIVYMLKSCPDCKRMHAGFLEYKRAVELQEHYGPEIIKISAVDPSIRVEYSKFLKLICE